MTAGISDSIESDLVPAYAPEQEIRFGIVMYGGVSLAVYINGVSQELLRLVKATAPDKPTADSPNALRLSEAEVSGSSMAVYRKLGRMLGAENRPAADITQDDPVRTRFVVDIISGTSAGGINGIYLAKALANDQDLEGIKQLWKNTADLAQLLNDRQTLKGLKGLQVPDPPPALLSSQRIYRELLKALEQMEGTRRTKSDQVCSPYADEIDLFVTTTDIYGLTLPIRLADKVVDERRYKNVFNFRYATPYATGEQQNDFHADNHPFLAFAARCTSAFPFAFEPMMLTDIDEVLRGIPPFNTDSRFLGSSPQWKLYYKDYLNLNITDFPTRSFGDGGYLDNYPFSYAIDALQRRSADVPTIRKLLYIEPAPQHPELEKDPTARPDFVENILKALIEIPRSETIREDLKRLLDRNNLIDRLSRITSNLESDVAHDIRIGHGAEQAQKWAAQDLRAMIEHYGAAYGAYHRMKVYSVTDDIARLITHVSADMNENSDQFLAIRYFVRAWRESQYVDYIVKPAGHPEAEATGPKPEVAQDKMQTQNRFLLDFDLSYRIRRLNFIRRKVDEVYKLDIHAKDVISAVKVDELYKPDAPAEDARRTAGIADYTTVNESARKQFRRELIRLKRELSRIFVDLRSEERKLHELDMQQSGAQPVSLANPLLESIKAIGLTWDEIKTVLCPQTESDREKEAAAMIKQKGREQHILAFATKLAGLYKAVFEQASKRVYQTLDLSDRSLPSAVLDARAVLRFYYDRYEAYDMITFPALYGANVGELTPVDVHRISPEDAIIPFCETLDRRKLAGTMFGHFGAFLQQFWRVNDMLWGRLDGAERIIRAVTPHLSEKEQDKLIQDKLIQEAQHSILAEELREEDRQTIKNWLVAVLTQMTPDQVQKLKQHPDTNTLLDYIKARLGIKGTDVLALPNLNAVLQACLSDEQLMDYLGKSYRVDTTLAPQPALRIAARSAAIIGRMLDGLASSKKIKNPVTPWLARIGQIAAGIVEVSVPQSMFCLLTRHWLKLFYLFEGLLILGGIVVSVPAAVDFGGKLLWLTLAVHLIVTLVNERMRDQNTIWRRTLQVFKFVVIIVFIYGAYSAYRDISAGARVLAQRFHPAAISRGQRTASHAQKGN